MADNSKPPLNDKQDNKPPVKSTLSKLIFPIILVVLVGVLLFYFLYNGNQKFAESYQTTDFLTQEKQVETPNDPNNPGAGSTTVTEYTYSGKIVDLLSNNEENNANKYGRVFAISGYPMPNSGFYYFNARVNTLIQDKKGTRYVPYVYEFRINANQLESFERFISTYTKADVDGNTLQMVYTRTVYSTQDNSWILTVVLFGGLIIIAVVLIRKMGKSFGGFMGQGPQFDPGASRAKKAIQSKTKFTDVAGCDEVKAELVEIVDYFSSVKKYTQLGATLPKGVLLVGPPGTGKTLLAKAVAGEANVPFYSISGSDFVEMYVGVGASRVRDMFKTAKQNAPCLVFIDEIDAVGRQRGAGLGGGNDEREQTLNQLLVEMDGFEENSGVIIMAATNRNDVLDPALTRPGRFDRIITVDYPDKEGREAILRVHARNKKISSDVDFDAIAKSTIGFAGADLANIMNEAAILAVRQNRNAITTKDIEEAIDRRIAGPAKSNKHLVDYERKQIAYHEAGHAIIGLKVPHSRKVQKITIVPRGRTGGHVLMTPENDTFIVRKSELLAIIIGLLGGRTSEEVFFGDVSTGASGDFEQATSIARSMVTRYGMSKLGPVQYAQDDGNVFLGRDYTTQRNLSDATALEIDAEIRRIIEECHAEARRVIEEYREDVELLANTVYERETITATEVEYLLKHRKLPDVPKTNLDVKYKKYESYQAKNPNDIKLHDNIVYKKLYSQCDKLLNINASIIILLVSDKTGAQMTMKDFQAKAKEMVITGRVGALFLNQEEVSSIGLLFEELESHFTKYSGITTKIIYADEESVLSLQEKFTGSSSSTKDESTNEQEKVTEVEAVEPEDNSKNSDEHDNSTSSSGTSSDSYEDLGFVKPKKKTDEEKEVKEDNDLETK